MGRPRKDQIADQARLDAEALDLYTQLGSYRRVGERQGVSFAAARDRIGQRWPASTPTGAVTG